MSALVHASELEFLVPEDRALAMIEECALRIEGTTTLPDVMRVITQADAIAAVMRKIKASERAKQAALRLQVDAEIRLGRITRTIPRSSRGARPVVAGGSPIVTGQASKGAILKKHGIQHSRAVMAEKMGETPRGALENAVQSSKTLRGVTVALGFQAGYKPEPPRAPMRKVAMDAIGLLVQCQSREKAPTAEQVDPLREAFTRAEGGVSG